MFPDFFFHFNNLDLRGCRLSLRRPGWVVPAPSLVLGVEEELSLWSPCLPKDETWGRPEGQFPVLLVLGPDKAAVLYFHVAWGDQRTPPAPHIPLWFLALSPSGPNCTHHEHGHVAQVLAVQGADVGPAGAELAAFGAPAPSPAGPLLAPPSCHRFGPLSPVPQGNGHWLRQVSHTTATYRREGCPHRHRQGPGGWPGGTEQSPSRQGTPLGWAWWKTWACLQVFSLTGETP